MQNVQDDDITYVEIFVQTELLSRIIEMCKRLNASLLESEKSNFFGCFASNVSSFKFSGKERRQIHAIVDILKAKKINQPHMSGNEFEQKCKSVPYWFCDDVKDKLKHSFQGDIEAPISKVHKTFWEKC